jgi:lactate 2-monooxygenase
MVVTLDTFTLAWRPVDLNHSHLPFLLGDGCQVGHLDPVFNEKYADTLAQDTRSALEKLSKPWNLIERNGTPFEGFRVLENAAKIAKSRACLDVMNLKFVASEWQHVEVLKKLWNSPIVLKGIQTVEDARKVIEYLSDRCDLRADCHAPPGSLSGVAAYRAH